MNIEGVMIGNTAVVFQGFGSARLFVQRSHGNIADFQQLGRGEKDEIGWIVINGIDHASLVEQHIRNAAAFQLDATRETGRPRSYYCHIELLHVSSPFALPITVQRPSDTRSRALWAATRYLFRPLPPYPGVRRPFRLPVSRHRPLTSRPAPSRSDPC